MQTYDMLDVIAILNAAARQPAECTEAPRPATVTPGNTTSVTDKNNDFDTDEPDGPGPEPKKKTKKRGNSIFKGISDYFATIFDEPEDSEDESK